MQFFAFNLMPWPYLPEDWDEQYDSAWVTLPNSFYDPQRGHVLYNQYLDQLEYAEQQGFDGIAVNEHHQTAYGTMPSPNVMAGILARRTSRAKIAVLGNAISLHNPVRIAEEIAMLDTITGGRIISGFVRGIGCEYHSSGMIPTESRDRFDEAHDLIVAAWTRPGPFRWEGKYFNALYVNPWPRPLQQPHPPIWVPSQGSSETIKATAQRRYTYLQTFSPFKHVKRYMAQLRAAARDCGYEAPPEQQGWAVPVYVAETDEQARREAAEHVVYLYNRLLKRPLPVFFPPGYLSEASMAAVYGSHGDLGVTTYTFDGLMDDGQCVVGSPDTVASRLERYVAESGVGTLVTFIHFGTLPHDLTMKNIKLFSEEVMPRLRQTGPALAKQAAEQDAVR